MLLGSFFYVIGFPGKLLHVQKDFIVIASGPSKISPFMSPPLTRDVLAANVGQIFRLSGGKPTLLSSLVVFCSSFAILGTPIWALALAYYFYRNVSWENKKIAFAGLFALYIVWPKKLKVRKWKLWDSWYNYFQVSLVVDDPSVLKTSAPYMFATVPHGIFPFGQAFSLVGKMSEIFKDLRPITVSSAMQIPLVGTLLRSVDAVLAGRDDIKAALRKNSNMMIDPGGVREMFYSGLDQEVGLLLNRKGFIKLAIEEGVTILPVYIFGNSQTYYLWPFFQYLEGISSKLGVSLTPFYGRLPFIWFPNFVKLLYVVAKPIVVSKKLNPTQHDVDLVHKKIH